MEPSSRERCRRSPASRHAVASAILAIGMLLVAATSAPAEPVRISGRLAKWNESPQAGVTVSLRADASPYERALAALEDRAPAPDVVSTITDAGGRFDLSAPSPGFWEVVARGQGVAASRRVIAAGDVELGTWKPPRSRELVVEVRDAAGHPVEGIRIAVEGSPTLAELTDEEGRASTDRDGIARLRAPAFGVTLLTSAPGREMTTVRVPESEVWEPGQPLPARRVALKIADAAPRLLRVLEPDGSPAAGALWIRNDTAVAAADEQGLLRVPPVAAKQHAGGFVIRSRSGASLEAGSALRAEAAPPRSTNGAEPRSEPKPLSVRLLAARLVEGVVRDAATSTPIGGALVFHREGLVKTVARDNGSFQVLWPASTRQLGLNARAGGYLESHWFGRPSVVDGEPIAATIEMLRGSPIDGVVVDPTGQPVSDAEVIAPETTAWTDENGRFRLAALPSNPPSGRELRLTVAHPDFALFAKRLSRAELAAPLRLVLEPGRDAIGWVVDDESRAVAGASVWLQAFGPDATGITSGRFAGRSTAKTDAEGRFRMTRLTAGSYTVMVEHAGHAPAAVPGVEVGPGTGEAELGTISLQPGLVVEGRTLTPDGTPLHGVEVIAWRSGSLPVFREAITDSDGRFSLVDLPRAGDMQLGLQKDGWLTPQLPKLSLPLARRSLELVLQPALSLAGRVEDRDGRPIASARVSARKVQGLSGGRTLSGPVGVDGAFSFDQLEAGVYDLTAEAAGHQPAKHRGITVAAATELEPIVLTLDRGATLSGRITDTHGEPLDKVYVKVHTGSAEQLGSAGTDQAGRYRVDGLPVGRASVTPLVGNRHGDVRDVVLEPGDNELDIVVERSDLLVRGHVLDAGGAPAFGASVAATIGGRSVGTFPVDADAAFEIPAEQGSALTLRATLRRGDASRQVLVEVRDTSVEGILLQMEPGATVRGRVLGLDLDRLTQARIQAHPRGVDAYSSSNTHPDFEGRFSLEDLAAGVWDIEVVEGSPFGRSVARTTVDLEAGAEVEIVLDATEEAGKLSLTGVVTEASEPVVGASVSAHAVKGPRGAHAVTGSDGSFELGGLPPGRYRVTVAAAPRVPHELDLELERDEHLTIELPAFSIGGTVVSRESGDPVPWAGVSLHRASKPPARWPAAQTRTDAMGDLSFSGVGPGAYSLHVTAEGHANRVVDLVVAESDLDLTVELETASGLALLVSGPGNRLPASVSVSVHDETGRRVMQGYYFAREGGRVEARDLPSGRWRLVVVDSDALAEVDVTVPGEPVAVQLVPGGYIEVEAAALAGTRGGERIELTRPDGGRHLLTDNERSRDLRAGRARIGPLLPGVWTVRLRLADRYVEATATVQPGRVVTVELR